MLFCTSLVAVVGCSDKPGSSTRKLQIVNTKVSLSVLTRSYVSQPRFQRQSVICELSFPTSVLSVKLNRRRLIVVLEEQIYVYDISNMKLLHTIETSPNPQGRPAVVRSDPFSLILVVQQYAHWRLHRTIAIWPIPRHYKRQTLPLVAGRHLVPRL